MKIYTKKGDTGQTTSISGERTDKDHPLIEALGTLDEVNATTGMLRSKLPPHHPWKERLYTLQKTMMSVMSRLGNNTGEEDPGLKQAVTDCETWIDEIQSEKDQDKPFRFILPGTNETEALCHMARTHTRRAERRIISLNKQSPVNPQILSFINRLSDLFFVLAMKAAVIF